MKFFGIGKILLVFSLFSGTFFSGHIVLAESLVLANNPTVTKVISRETDTVVEQFYSGQGDRGPIVINSDASRAYILKQYWDGRLLQYTGLYIINLNDYTLIDQLAVYGRDMIITEDDKYLYITSPSFISVVDTDTLTEVDRIYIEDPQYLAIIPGSNHMLVTHFYSGISTIDLTTNTIASTYNLYGHPRDIAISPNGQKAYITNLDSSHIRVINITNPTALTELATIDVGDYPLSATLYVAITPDGKKLFVSSISDRAVYVIDTINNLLLVTISMIEGYPTAIAVTPDGKQAYVTVRMSGSEGGVSVIDTNSYGVTRIATGGSDGIAITPNLIPIANAGADQTVHTGSVATLDGIASSDPDENYPLTYAWTITSKPTSSSTLLNDANTAAPFFTADVYGIYEVALIVTDALGKASAPESVIVSTNNAAPVSQVTANPQAVTLVGTTLQLDGSQSYDPDGDDITYLWTWVQKPEYSTAAFSDETVINPTFTADIKGDYVASLKVVDTWDASSSMEIRVSFDNIKPVADAGAYAPVVAGESVTLDGSASSDVNDDTLTYQWSLVSQPDGSLAAIFNSENIQAQLATDLEGTYIVSLKVNDALVDSDPSNATIEAIVIYTPTIELLEQAIEAIQSFSNDSFKNKNQRKALINKLSATIKMVTRSKYVKAINKLENDLLRKMDGCLDSNQADKKDWIVDCEDQTVIYELFAQAVEQLANSAE